MNSVVDNQQLTKALCPPTGRYGMLLFSDNLYLVNGPQHQILAVYTQTLQQALNISAPSY